MSNSIKAKTLGEDTFSQQLKVFDYNITNPLAQAKKSQQEEVTSWCYIESTNTSLSDTTHTIEIAKSYGKIGDCYIAIQLPANTYVANTLSSMLKEVRFNYGNDDPIKYSGETLHSLLNHVNRSEIRTILHTLEQSGTSAVSAATWYVMPLLCLGSKCLYSSEYELYNTPFDLQKLSNNLRFECDIYPYAKFITTGSTTTGKLRIYWKQYEYINNNNISSVNSWIMPYTLRTQKSLSLDTSTETSCNMDDIKGQDAEMVEIILKLVLDSNYKATAPLLYTSNSITSLYLELKNQKLYDGLAPNIMKAMYLNEYGHDHTDAVASSSYDYYVIDLSETPMLTYSSSSGSVGINMSNENPLIKLTPTGTHSAAAATLAIIAVYKALYVVQNGTVVRKMKF